jgi:catechol 2,3-dioxygenase-like lactoylglutathione lyase family enzyme
MLADIAPVGFVATVDVTRAAAFYVDVLGLPMVEQTPFATVVQSGPTFIRITPVDGHQPVSHTVLGWAVPDVTAALRTLHDRGVEALRFDGLEQDGDGAWTAPGGARVAWFHDPDGNILSLTQTAPSA